jgi:hypothetical protein
MGLTTGTKLDVERQCSDNSPPTYSQTTEQLLAIPALSLSQDAGPAKYTTITHFECIAHLKFLAALSDSRDTITSLPNLYGIPDPSARQFSTQINEAWALVKEKRWAVYTAKAVQRYTTWWNHSVPASRPRPSVHQFTSSVYEDVTVCNDPMSWTRDMLPPLGEPTSCS